MPDTKITDLTTGTTVVPADWFVYVDVSDTSMAATGTDKKLSPSVLVAGLPAFGASGTNHAPGVVPDPGASAGATKFLREDATWVVPAGGSGLTPIANNQVLANITGSSAVPIGLSLTGVIDSAIGNVQGSVLYRDSAAWLALPPGTNGQALASQGPAANPHWITLGGGTGTVTSITAGSGITASPSPITAAGTLSIANSALTYSMLQNEAAATLLGNPTGSPAAPAEITLGPNLTFVGSAIRGRVPICTILSPGTAIANTTTLTSIFTGATLAGSLTIPANTLQVGSVLRFSLSGTFGNTTGTPTLLGQVSLGGTIVGQSTAAPFNASAVTGNIWNFDHFYGEGGLIQVSGLSGKILFNDSINLAAQIRLDLNASGTNFGAPAQVTINTTTSLLIDIKIQWGTAATLNTFQLLGGCIYLDG